MKALIIKLVWSLYIFAALVVGVYVFWFQLNNPEMTNTQVLKCIWSPVLVIHLAGLCILFIGKK